MDPLSVIASIAGIAAAGSALSKAIYEFVSSTRGASREMLDIARTIADLSIILGELRRVLRDGSELCNRKYLRRIKSATRRISRIHREIHQLMDDSRGFASFKWRLKRSEVQEKLARIECHKTAINLMLNILVLAITTRKQSRLSDAQSYKDGQQDQRHQEQDQEQDIRLLHQQSENLAYAAHQSLVELSESQGQHCDSDLEQPNDTLSDQDNDAGTQLQVQKSRQGSDDTAIWLFDLAFSPYTQAHIASNNQSSVISGTDPVSRIDDDTQEQPFKNRNGSPSHNLSLSSPSELSMAIYDPGATGSVVKELLADWTVLTEKEIKSTTDRQCLEEKEGESSKGSQNKDAFIFLKDAVGRKFKLPLYKVEKFEGMHRLLNSVFANVDSLGPPVRDGCFYLQDSDGYQLVPELWDDLIRPGMDITMAMWPTDKLPPPISSILPGRPAQPTNPKLPPTIEQVIKGTSTMPQQPTNSKWASRLEEVLKEQRAANPWFGVPQQPPSQSTEATASTFKWMSPLNGGTR